MLINRIFKPIYHVTERIIGLRALSKIEFRQGYDIKQIEGNDGDEVPQIFREFRHVYSTKPTDIAAYKRQVMYRCEHIGTKELELVLRDWLVLN